ncbi:hypothetical protein [uncultured Gimesia sp.]|uniref:hypothetical protein n=1 Tax=uncultured Gimesia sp. TaxID=1678688 RepID=UPI00260DBF28|nr:hypothetical protein [uncultured Gimesia sp.]
MSNRQPNAFHRAFPAREFFRGSARSVLIWSLVNGLLLALLAVNLFLIVDLLNHRGRITIRGKQNVLRIQELRNIPPLVIDSDQAKSEKTPEKSDKEPTTKLSEPIADNAKSAESIQFGSDTLVLTDSGILPSVW